jgi:hypothetical protein
VHKSPIAICQEQKTNSSCMFIKEWVREQRRGLIVDLGKLCSKIWLLCPKAVLVKTMFFSIMLDVLIFVPIRYILALKCSNKPDLTFWEVSIQSSIYN